MTQVNNPPVFLVVAELKRYRCRVF